MLVDLFLNGPLGAWVLDQVDVCAVGCVHSPTFAIQEHARALGIPAYGGNANFVEYEPNAVGLSMHYPYILKPHVLGHYSALYNVHPGLLPWGRCYYPVFWALWADEPCGCTLHRIDSGIDTGAIIDQRKVPKYDWDTGGTLHRRVSEMEKALFLEWWPCIVADAMPAGKPQGDGGSFHYQREFFELKDRARDGALSADKLLHLIRCLSHEEYTGLLVRFGGRQYEISARPVKG